MKRTFNQPQKTVPESVGEALTAFTKLADKVASELEKSQQRDMSRSVKTPTDVRR